MGKAGYWFWPQTTAGMRGMVAKGKGNWAYLRLMDGPSAGSQKDPAGPHSDHLSRKRDGLLGGGVQDEVGEKD
jgi:hypothetical protein